MGPVQLDAQNPDITENPYFKKIRESLKKKSAASNQVDRTNSDANKVDEEVSRHAISEEADKISKQNSFEDQVHLSSLSFEDEFLSDHEGDQSSVDEKKKQELDLKNNGERILRYLGHQINFEKKLPELKTLLKETIIQARSPNYFLSQFAKFKVGVVGQILSALNVPIAELRELKREAIKDAFDENVEMMGENVYNRELSELLGHSRRKKRMSKVYDEVQSQLISQMNNIGRVGYWSNDRLLEEKVKQLKRIHDEFSKRYKDVVYMLDYHEQIDSKEAA